MYIPNTETKKKIKKNLYTACKTKICRPLYTSFKGHYFIVYTFCSAGTKRNQIIYQSIVATKFKTVHIAFFRRNISQICIKSLDIFVIIYKLQKKYTKLSYLTKTGLARVWKQSFALIVNLDGIQGGNSKKEVGY